MEVEPHLFDEANTPSGETADDPVDIGNHYSDPAVVKKKEVEHVQKWCLNQPTSDETACENDDLYWEMYVIIYDRLLDNYWATERFRYHHLVQFMLNPEEWDLGAAMNYDHNNEDVALCLRIYSDLGLDAYVSEKNFVHFLLPFAR